MDRWKQGTKVGILDRAAPASSQILEFSFLGGLVIAWNLLEQFGIWALVIFSVSFWPFFSYLTPFYLVNIQTGCLLQSVDTDFFFLMLI